MKFAAKSTVGTFLLLFQSMTFHPTYVMAQDIIKSSIEAAQSGCLGSVSGEEENAISTEAQLSQLVQKVNRKIKVVILYGSQGGGHISAADAFEKALNPELYEVVRLDILKGKIKGEELFDQFFSEEKWKHLKMTVALQPVADQMVKLFKSSQIHKEIAVHKPDLIISTFPVGINVYDEVARSLKVPLVIGATDYHLKAFLSGVPKKSSNQLNEFSIFIPENDEKMIKMLKKNKIFAYEVSGYPVRPDIQEMAAKFRRHDPALLQQLQAVRESYGMKEGDQAVFMSMGAKAFGQKTILEYLRTLNENHDQVVPANDRKVHIIVAAGKNEDLHKEIKALNTQFQEKNSPIVIHTEGWMNAKQMAERILISKFPFVKPGGSTIGEIRALGKPMLIKSDSEMALPWEKYNMNSSLSYGGSEALAHVGKNGIDQSDFIQKFRAMLEGQVNTVDFPENHFSSVAKESINKKMVHFLERKVELEELKKEESDKKAAKKVLDKLNDLTR